MCIVGCPIWNCADELYGERWNTFTSRKIAFQKFVENDTDKNVVPSLGVSRKFWLFRKLDFDKMVGLQNFFKITYVALSSSVIFQMGSPAAIVFQSPVCMCMCVSLTLRKQFSKELRKPAKSSCVLYFVVFWWSHVHVVLNLFLYNLKMKKKTNNSLFIVRTLDVPLSRRWQFRLRL